MKTVIKGKPTPIGYKVYTVASHGYLLNFDIYKGKGGYTSAQGVIHHTVVNLVTRWSREHRILFLIICTLLQPSVVISFLLASIHVVLCVLTEKVCPLISNK